MSRRRGGKTAAALLSGSSDVSEMEPVEVFCRLRPVTPPGSHECAKQVSFNRLRLIPPESAVAKNPLAKPTESEFTEVLEGSMEQGQIFERVCSSLVSDLVIGKNGLLFAYGITGSGKTYTMTGNPEATGILPRALDILFNSISDLLTPPCVFYPDGYNRFHIRSEGAAQLARQDASRRHRTNPNPHGQKANGRRKREGSDDDWEMVPREKENGRVAEVDEDNGYAVFVSYVEIYNNYVYDLLDPQLRSSGGGKLASKGPLRDDVTKMTYVSELTEVEVSSTDEAFQLFISGQQNRRIAQTALNAESSRSHSVFNIRLVQAPLDASGSQLLQDKSKVHVSQLSLVDLAGSERSNRTGNSGDRMAESSHINASLMTLRRCIETLRENQKGGKAGLVPYRESRLTYLFKSYFEGKGKVRMVVCVNPSSADYEENLHVMQFAEMTQEVAVARGEELDYGRLFPDLPSGRRNAAKYQAAVEAELAAAATGQVNSSSQPYLFDSLPRLRPGAAFTDATMASMREAILARRQSRQNFTAATMTHADEGLQKLSLYVNTAEINRRALRDLENAIPQLEKENADTRAQARLHTRTIADLRSRLAKAESDETLRLHSERVHRRKEKDLEAKVKMSEARFAAMRDALAPINSGGTDGGGSASLPRQSQTGAPRPAPRSSSRSRATAQTLSLPRTAKAPLYPRLPTIPGTPAPPSTTSTTDGTTQEDSLQSQERGRTRLAAGRTEAGGTPTLDPRTRRRSKSLTIHHEPENKVPGAALTSDFKAGRTRRTSRPRSGDLAQASDYALTHQELDDHGNVRTSLYKADVLPTIAGGSAVVFNDVEELSHRDLKRPSPPGNRRKDKAKKHRH